MSTDELLTAARRAGDVARELLDAEELAGLTGDEPPDQEEINELIGAACTAYAELDALLSRHGAILPLSYQQARPFAMPEGCDVVGHVSKVHGGLNVEIDAPADMKVTVFLNDSRIFIGVVPE